MPSLNVNFDELQSVAGQIRTLGEEFDGLLKKVRTANENLKLSWEGTDGAKYAQSVENQAIVMQDLSNTIQDISNYLDHVRNAYSETMQSNMSGLQG